VIRARIPVAGRAFWCMLAVSQGGKVEIMVGGWPKRSHIHRSVTVHEAGVSQTKSPRHYSRPSFPCSQSGKSIALENARPRLVGRITLNPTAGPDHAGACG
jgi:hypothetical protein